MNWGEAAGAESVEIVGGGTMRAGVLEGDPRAAVGKPGQTAQRVQLLALDGRRLDPPARLVVRGSVVRVLGTQVPPWPGEPSIVTCERVNPNLPDRVRLVSVGARTLDPVTALYTEVTTQVWTGDAHVVSGVPSTVDLEGEDAPLDRVTVTVPLSAPYAEGLRVEVTDSRVPGLTGRHFTASGEVLDSDAALRRFVAYRPGA